MELLGNIAIAAVAVASTTVGVHLLLVARRTGGFPELVLGGSLAGITGVGFPVVLLTELRATLGPALTFTADFVGSFIVALGFVGFYVFTWRVFRPAERWARAVTLLGSAGALGATAGTVWKAVGIVGNEAKFAAVREWEILLFASAAAGFLWTTIESFRLYARLRRQLALGISEATVANRILLWGLTGAVASAGLATLMLLRLADVNYMQAPVALFATSLCGLLASGLLYLAFLPPRAYLRWVEGARG